MEKIIEELGLEQNITLEDIPNIDLYMDQVIQLFENKYKSTKRDENDKILTKTMINNYAKGKLFNPVKNKKYSKEHLIIISLIYQLKGALSINDIKKVLDGLNKKVAEDAFPLDLLYESYLDLSNRNAEKFKVDFVAIDEDAKGEIINLEDDDHEYLQQVLLISSLVHMSNLYRRAAERLVDQLMSGEREHIK